MKRCALYHRVSTSDQHPELLREQLHMAALARDFEVVLNVEETGSGARADRPGWRQVLDAATRHEIDAVLVWKLDRVGRSALDVLHSIEHLTQRGVRFVAVTQAIDFKGDGDAMTRLLLTVLSAVAELEREMLSERTRAGLAGAKRRGQKLGRPPKKLNVTRLRRLYAKGFEIKELAARYRVSKELVRNRLLGAGVVLRDDRPAGLKKGRGLSPRRFEGAAGVGGLSK